MQCRCFLALPSRQYRQSLWIMIEQNKGAADGAARQQVAAFIFLKRTRPAADDQPSHFLGQPQLFANAPYFIGLKQALTTGFKPIQHPVGYSQVFTDKDAFIRLVAIPARLVEGDRLVFVRQRHGTHIAAH